jgi:hypothetical protein
VWDKCTQIITRIAARDTQSAALGEAFCELVDARRELNVRPEIS